MKLDENSRSELSALLESVCENRVSVTAQSRLESLVLNDPAACEYYIRYMQLHGALMLETAPLRGTMEVPLREDHCESLPTKRAGGPSAPAPHSPVLGFLDKMKRVSGDTPLAAALMWAVMGILCSGMVLTIVFCILLVYRGVGVNVHVDAPQVAKSGEPTRGFPAGSGEPRPEIGDQKSEVGDPTSDRRLRTSDLRPPTSSPSSPTVARLVRAYDCHWAIGSHSPHSGDDLEPGRKLALMSGLAEIMFQSGVRAVLQGPATLEVASKSSAFLRQGRLTVTVLDPEAHGFEIDAPGMKYTDLGTEFGVFVAKDGAQEMHVFRGQVRAEQAEVRNQKPGDPPRPTSDVRPLTSPILLSANQAIRVAASIEQGNAADAIKPIAADEKQFVRTEQFTAIVAAASPDFQRWKKFNNELCKRPDLVAYYDFQPDEADSTALRNRAATGARYDGKLVGGAEWCDGRFPGKQAVEFEHSRAGVRVKIDTDLPDATFAAWVRFNDLAAFGADGWAKSDRNLVASDRWNLRPGMTHWRVHADGTMSLACCDMRGTELMETRALSGVPNGVDSLRVYSPAGPGGWHFLASAVSFSAGELVHYFDGREVGRGAVKGSGINLGAATFGNWNHLGTQPADERPLRGRMDELIILRSALSRDAIRQWYETRSPEL